MILLYLLSYAPVMAFNTSMRGHVVAVDVGRRYYTPLSWLEQKCRPLQPAQTPYVDFWLRVFPPKANSGDESER